MAQDISNLYVSESFQNLVLVSSSAEGNILADALGNVFTPQNAISASYAVSASHEIIKEVSSSHADYADSAGTALTADVATSSSHAIQADSALNADNAIAAQTAVTASYALNVTDPTWDNITDKPAGLVSGSSQITLADATGDLSGSRISGPVADAVNAVSASHSINADSSLSSNVATSASYATTASYALNIPVVETGSLLQSAAATDATITFERANGSTFNVTIDNVSTALVANDAISASAADTATSASYAVSSSYVEDMAVVKGDGIGSIESYNASTSQTKGQSSISLGDDALASGDEAISIGAFTIASNNGSIAIGKQATSIHSNSVAIGTNAITTADNQIQIEGAIVAPGGITSTLSGNASTATSASHATNADVAISSNSALSASHALEANNAITANSANTSISSSYALTASYIEGGVATPTLQQVTDQGSTSTNAITANIIGNLTGNADTATTASYVDGVAVVKGDGTDSLESYNATGNQGDSSIALGRVASATGNFAIALGDGAVASNNQSTAIGEGAISSHARSIAIGNGATTTAADQIQLKGNVVAANGITADLTGNADTATSASHAETIDVTGDTGDTDFNLLLSNDGNVKTSNGFYPITYNPSNGLFSISGGNISGLDRLASTQITGSLNGNADTATSASHAIIADEVQSVQTASDSAYSILLGTPSGNEVLKGSPIGMNYNPGTGIGDGRLQVQNLTAIANFTASGINYPTTDGDLGMAIVTDGDGNLSFADVNGTAISASYATTADTATSASHAVNADIAISSSHALAADTSISSSHAVNADTAILATNATNAANTIVTGKNVSGAEIQKGTPLYFDASGTQGNLVGVYPADASNPARMPAGGIAGETLAIGAEGIVLLDGYIGGVDTSLFQSGDLVYVAVGGGYTNQKPTGSTNQIQYLGNIEKSAINGSGVVNMMGEAHSVPNIAEGFIWVGNSDGVATATATSSFAKLDENNTFTGTQTFSIITADSASFGSIQTITGSATIIGDSIIVLNNDTPTQRYAGIAVYDSGSAGVTASLEFDGASNDWFYEYSDDGGVTTDHGVVMFGPEYSDKGTPTYNTANTILKSNGGHHTLDSSITDTGTLVTVNNPLTVTGQISGNVTGTLTGNASSATSASHAINADLALTANTATTAGSATTASYVEGANVDGTVATATSASHALQADNAVISDNATTASYVAGANVDGTVATATSASYALTASYLEGGISTPTLQQVTDQGSTTTDNITLNGGGLYFTGTGTEILSVELDGYDSTPINFTKGGSTWLRYVHSSTVNRLDFGSNTGVTNSIYGNLTFGNNIIMLGSLDVASIDATSNVSGLNGIFGNIVTSSRGEFSTYVESPEFRGTATTASYVEGANVDGTVISASHAIIADSALTADSATTAISSSHAVQADSALTADTATSASHAIIADSALTADTATSASYAPTNTADDITWTGNQVFSGSVRGEVETLSIASTTASMDLTAGNFYDITLAAGADTHLVATNINAGQTINLQVTQNATAGTISFPDYFKFEDGTDYVASTGSGAIDIVTFISFDGTNLLASSVKNLA